MILYQVSLLVLINFQLYFWDPIDYLLLFPGVQENVQSKKFFSKYLISKHKLLLNFRGIQGKEVRSEVCRHWRIGVTQAEWPLWASLDESQCTSSHTHKIPMSWARLSPFYRWQLRYIDINNLFSYTDSKQSWIQSNMAPMLVLLTISLYCLWYEWHHGEGLEGPTGFPNGK